MLGSFCGGFGGDGVAVGGFLGACFGVSSESQASSPGVLTTPISSYVFPVRYYLTQLYSGALD